MDDYTLLDIEGASFRDMKPRVSDLAVEITRGCQLAPEWDEVFAGLVISLSKFTLDEQLSLAAKVNIMHIQRLQDVINVLVKYNEDNDLNQ